MDAAGSGRRRVGDGAGIRPHEIAQLRLGDEQAVGPGLQVAEAEVATRVVDCDVRDLVTFWRDGRGTFGSPVVGETCLGSRKSTRPQLRGGAAAACEDDATIGGDARLSIRLRVSRQLLDRAGLVVRADRHAPDVEFAAAIRRKDDGAPIEAPRRLSIRRAARGHTGPLPGWSHDPDVAANADREPAVAREGGLTRPDPDGCLCRRGRRDLARRRRRSGCLKKCDDERRKPKRHDGVQ